MNILLLLTASILTLLLTPVFNNLIDLIYKPDTKDLFVHIKINETAQGYELYIEETVTYIVFPGTSYREFYRKFNDDIDDGDGRCLNTTCITTVYPKEISVKAVDRFWPGEYRIQYTYKYLTNTKRYLLYDNLSGLQGMRVLLEGRWKCSIDLQDLYIISPVSVEIDFERCEVLTFPVPKLLLSKQLLIILSLFPVMLMLVKLLHMKLRLVPARYVSLEPIDIAYVLHNWVAIPYIRYLELRREGKIDEDLQEESKLTELDRKMMMLVKYTKNQLNNQNPKAILNDIVKNLNVSIKNYKSPPMTGHSMQPILVFSVLYLILFPNLLSLTDILLPFYILFILVLNVFYMTITLFIDKSLNNYSYFLRNVLLIALWLGSWIIGLAISDLVFYIDYPSPIIITFIVQLLFLLILIFDRNTTPLLLSSIKHLDEPIGKEILGIYKFIYDFTNIPNYDIEKGSTIYNRLYEYALALDIPENVMNKLREKLGIGEDKRYKSYRAMLNVYSQTNQRIGHMVGGSGRFRGGGGGFGRR